MKADIGLCIGFLVFLPEHSTVGLERYGAHNVDSHSKETGILLSLLAQELKLSFPPAATHGNVPTVHLPLFPN